MAVDPNRTVNINIRATDGVSSNARKIAKGLSDVDRNTKKSTESLEKNQKSQSSVSKSSFGLATKLKALAAGFLAVSTVRAVDEMQSLQQQVKSLSDSTEDFRSTWQELSNINMEVGSGLQTLTKLNNRIIISKENLGLTNDEALRLTETVSKIGVIGGSSFEEARFATRQLGQALSMTTFKAEELNSLSENMPLIFEKVASKMSEMGILQVQAGESAKASMRNLVLEGKLLSKDFAAALMGLSDEIDQEFSEVEDRLDRSFNKLKDSSLILLTTLDDISGASKGATTVMNFLASAINKTNDAIESFSSAKLKKEIDEALFNGDINDTVIGQLSSSTLEGMVDDITKKIERLNSSEFQPQFGVGEKKLDKLKKMLESTENALKLSIERESGLQQKANQHKLMQDKIAMQESQRLSEQELKNKIKTIHQESEHTVKNLDLRYQYRVNLLNEEQKKYEENSERYKIIEQAKLESEKEISEEKRQLAIQEKVLQDQLFIDTFQKKEMLSETEKQEFERKINAIDILIEKKREQNATEINEAIISKDAILSLEKQKHDISNQLALNAANSKKQIDYDYVMYNASILGQLASMQLGQSKEAFELNKAGQLAQATVDGLAGIQKTASAYPYPANILPTAIQTAISAGNIASIASQKYNAGNYNSNQFNTVSPAKTKKYNQGGFVDSTSTVGDKTLIRVDGGEQIINKSQQNTIQSEISQLTASVEKFITETSSNNNNAPTIKIEMPTKEISFEVSSISNESVQYSRSF